MVDLAAAQRVESQVDQAQNAAAIAYMTGVGQPVSFDPKVTPLTNGQTLVVLYISRPADTMTVAMEAKQCLDLGKKLMQAGRTALTGLTIIGDATGAADDVLDEDPSQQVVS